MREVRRASARHCDDARRLRHVEPSVQIVGASPEMLVKVDAPPPAPARPRLYMHPIAGTRKRGTTPEEDAALGAELLADAKERAEHVRLVAGVACGR